MKTHITLFLVLLLSVGIFTSCDESKKAPNSKMDNTFNSMYPHAKHPRWEREGNYYVVEFIEEGNEKEAWFNPNGEWYLTRTEFHRTMPELIWQAVDKTEYRDWRIDDVDYIEQRESYVNFYRIEMEMGEMEVDLYFSPAGDRLEERPQMIIPLAYL